ncbi:MAG: hypothetical protein ACKPKO_48230, partial [Candidatus Fonsibacter sp.]
TNKAVSKDGAPSATVESPRKEYCGEVKPSQGSNIAADDMHAILPWTCAATWPTKRHANSSNTSELTVQYAITNLGSLDIVLEDTRYAKKGGYTRNEHIPDLADFGDHT